MKKQQKKYVVIAQVGENYEEKRCVKYNVNDILKTVEFLKSKFGNWFWLNVYCKKTRAEKGRFTKKFPPTSKTV